MDINSTFGERLSKAVEFGKALRDVVISTEDFDARQRMGSDLDDLFHKIRLTDQSAVVASAPRCNLGQWSLANERSRELVRETFRLARRYDLWTDQIQEDRRY